MKSALILIFVGMAAPRPAIGEVVSFEQAAKKMLDQHPDILIQESKVRVAKENRRVKSLSLLPSLSLSVTESSSQLSGGNQTNIEGVANLNLFKFGADAASIQVADLELELQATLLQQVKQTAEIEILESVFEYIENKELGRIYQQSVERSQATLKVARARYEKGLLPIQEVEKSELDLANSVARATDAGMRFSKSEEIVARRLGSGLEIEAEWPWKKIILVDMNHGHENLKMEDRPDIRAYQLQMDIDSKKSTQAFRSLFPSLDLAYRRGRYDLKGANFDGWSSAIVLSVPLFSGGQDYGFYKSNSEAHFRSQLQFNKKKVESDLEFKTSKLNYSVARQSVLARDKSLRTAERLLDANKKRFEMGRATVNDLSYDYGRVFESEILNSQGWLNAHVSLMKLKIASGQSNLMGLVVSPKP